MKAIHLDSLNNLLLSEVPDPTAPEGNEVLLRVECIGVCGSDIHYFRTGRIGEQVVEFPFILGHEFSATVLETGTGVKNLKPGDRVAVDPAMPCFECEQCRQGRENTCLNLLFLGCPGQAEGAMKEKILMPAHCCFKIPDSMSLEEAVLVEPLSIGYYAAQRAGNLQGRTVAVLGAGPIGDSVLLSARHSGAARIVVTDRISERVKLAGDLGADYGFNVDLCDATEEIKKVMPDLADIVFECSGEQEAFDQGIELLKPGGILVLVGIPEFERWSFRADQARRKELSIIHIRRQNGCVQAAIDLIASGKYDFGKMITHHFALEQSQQAFETVASYSDGVLKALLDLRMNP